MAFFPELYRKQKGGITMMHISTVPQSKQLVQIVDAALTSFATPEYELNVDNSITVPEQLQHLMCQPGLVLLSGRPGMGSTSLALNIALSIAKIQRRSVLYFPFDTTKEILMQKLLCIEGMVNTQRIWDHDFTDADWVRLTTAGKLIKELPLHIYDDPLLTVGEINQICRQHKYVDLVIIDSLQNVQSLPGELDLPKRARKENRILQQLKQLSKEHNTCVLCLNTLGSDVENRICRAPDVCDIRKYRKSFDYIDTALFLYREDYYTKEPTEDLTAFCYVRLNRRGESYYFHMRWIPEYATFLEHRFCHAE